MKFKQEIVKILQDNDYICSIVKLYDVNGDIKAMRNDTTVKAIKYSSNKKKYEYITLFLPFLKNEITIQHTLLFNGNFCNIEQICTYNNESTMKAYNNIPIYACGSFLYITMMSVILFTEYDTRLVRLASPKFESQYIAADALSILEFCELELNKVNSAKQLSMRDILVQISDSGTNEETDNLAKTLGVLDGYNKIKTYSMTGSILGKLA